MTLQNVTDFSVNAGHPNLASQTATGMPSNVTDFATAAQETIIKISTSAKTVIESTNPAPDFNTIRYGIFQSDVEVTDHLMTTSLLISWASNVSSVDATSPLTDLEVETYLQHKNDEFTLLVLPAIVFLAILFVIGVLGNTLVLYVYNQKLRKGTIRWFIQALAVFDLLSCLVAIPAEIVDMRNNYTFGLSPMCKVLRTVSMFCTVASGVTLMVVAVERYKRICKPLRQQISPKTAQIIVVACTVVATICAAPAAVIYGKQTIPTDNPDINGSDCSTADTFIDTVLPLAFSSFQCILFLAGATGLVVLYALIGKQIWSHARFRRVGFNSGVNRRMSFIFTGSECSSPTTEEGMFTFPNRRSGGGCSGGGCVGGGGGETSSGSSNGNTDAGNIHNNNNIDSKSGPADDSINPLVHAATDTAVHKAIKGPRTNTDKEVEKTSGSIFSCNPPRVDGSLKSETTLLTADDTQKTNGALLTGQSCENPVPKTGDSSPTNGSVLKENSIQTPSPNTEEKQQTNGMLRRQISSTTTDATANTLPRKKQSFSRQTSRERHRSGDSNVKGRYRRRASAHTQSDLRRFLNRSDSVNSGTRRTTLMLFLITVVYLLSFLPYLILMVVKALDKDSLSGRGDGWEMAHNILLRSYFINSMANPIIYSFCSRTFRKETDKFIHCRCCKK